MKYSIDPLYDINVLCFKFNRIAFGETHGDLVDLKFQNLFNMPNKRKPIIFSIKRGSISRKMGGKD